MDLRKDVPKGGGQEGYEPVLPFLRDPGVGHMLAQSPGRRRKGKADEDRERDPPLRLRRPSFTSFFSSPSTGTNRDAEERRALVGRHNRHDIHHHKSLIQTGLILVVGYQCSSRHSMSNQRTPEELK